MRLFITLIGTFLMVNCELDEPLEPLMLIIESDYSEEIEEKIGTTCSFEPLPEFPGGLQALRTFTINRMSEREIIYRNGLCKFHCI